MSCSSRISDDARRDHFREFVVSLLSNLLSAKSSPTADLYLGWSCADLISGGSIQQLAPTVFQVERTLVVIRHDAHLRKPPDYDRLIYVIDDDWRAGLRDKRLPLDYRIKLRIVEAQAARRLEARADLIVVASHALQTDYKKRYPHKPIEILAPTWMEHTSKIHDNSQICEAEREVRIAILGARTHRSDLAFLAPVIADLLIQRSNLRFFISSEAGPPSQLMRDPNITQIPSMSWGKYLHAMKGTTFDIGLYRLGPSEFNAARSINKLLEYDRYGAAVIGSKTWSEAEDAAARGQCSLVPDDPKKWHAEILRLIDAPKARYCIATTNRNEIRRASMMEQQQKFWKKLLKV